MQLPVPKITELCVYRTGLSRKRFIENKI